MILLKRRCKGCKEYIWTKYDGPSGYCAVKGRVYGLGKVWDTKEIL